jgi:hypothetical protein
MPSATLRVGIEVEDDVVVVEVVVVEEEVVLVEEVFLVEEVVLVEEVFLVEEVVLTLPTLQMAEPVTLSFSQTQPTDEQSAFLVQVR